MRHIIIYFLLTFVYLLLLIVIHPAQFSCASAEQFGADNTLKSQVCVYVYRRIKVNVTNGMSSTGSWLCPSVVVISQPLSPVTPDCRPTVTIVNRTTLDSPLTTLRSTAVTLTATSQLQVHIITSSL